MECGELSARPEDTLEDFRGFDLLGALTANLEVGRVRTAEPGRGAGGPG